MYQHDNDVRLQVLLGSKVIQRRNQRNAITFFGQFCSFAFEIGLNMVMISAVEGNASWDVVILFKMVAFTSMAIIEDLTNPSLRRRVIWTIDKWTRNENVCVSRSLVSKAPEDYLKTGFIKEFNTSIWNEKYISK